MRVEWALYLCSKPRTGVGVTVVKTRPESESQIPAQAALGWLACDYDHAFAGD